MYVAEYTDTLCTDLHKLMLEYALPILFKTG